MYIINKYAQNKWRKRRKKIYNIAKTVRRIYNKTIKINQTITGEMEESK